jgi:hypothetical protein
MGANAMMKLLKTTGPIALLLAYLFAAYILSELTTIRIGVTDIYIFSRFSVTYLYDGNEGPAFWLYDGKHFLGRWPKYQSRSTLPTIDYTTLNNEDALI